MLQCFSAGRPLKDVINTHTHTQASFPLFPVPPTLPSTAGATVPPTGHRGEFRCRHHFLLCKHVVVQTPVAFGVCEDAVFYAYL